MEFATPARLVDLYLERLIQHDRPVGDVSPEAIKAEERYPPLFILAHAVRIVEDHGFGPPEVDRIVLPADLLRSLVSRLIDCVGRSRRMVDELLRHRELPPELRGRFRPPV